MKKGIIIAIILCLLGMIFLSGSIGVFYEPVEVSNKAIVVAILIITFIICNFIKHILNLIIFR